MARPIISRPVIVGSLPVQAVDIFDSFNLSLKPSQVSWRQTTVDPDHLNGRDLKITRIAPDS